MYQKDIPFIYFFIGSVKTYLKIGNFSLIYRWMANKLLMFFKRRGVNTERCVSINRVEF